MSRSVLLVDGDPEVLAQLGQFFEVRGWQVERATDATGALAIHERERADLVLLDVCLPGVSGLQLLEVLRSRDSDAAIIMLTRLADIPIAMEAMKLGAESFLTKPLQLAHVEAAAERAWEKAELRMLSRFLAERSLESTDPGALGRSSAMRDIARNVERLAASDASVLITGEAGTGKGYVAQLLHALSPRAAHPFVEVNCSFAAVDSQVFGHEKGAFAAAKRPKRGLLEVARSGTFFLDDVADLGVDLQPKLLGVIENRRFRRVGGTRERHVDVRVVAATRHDLDRQVREGRFREDLFHRLNLLPLRLPPVRERGREEIADLALRTLADLRRRLGRGPARFTADALDLISGYAWPGNIRELRTVLERILLLWPEIEEIDAPHLPPEMSGCAARFDGADDACLSLEEVERRHIARVLAHHAGNRSQAARTLRISRATLYEKLARYDLDQVGRARAPRRKSTGRPKS